jgi:hypothetical protein
MRLDEGVEEEVSLTTERHHLLDRAALGYSSAGGRKRRKKERKKSQKSKKVVSCRRSKISTQKARCLHEKNKAF